jgi:hypothetical protein
MCICFTYRAQIQPRRKKNANWILAMQDELNQFEMNDAWELALRPKNQSIIGIKWVFRNKVNEHAIIVRNKARLVVKGYNQEEDIDYEETFTLVAKLESIRMLLTFACHANFMFFFSNGCQKRIFKWFYHRRSIC